MNGDGGNDTVFGCTGIDNITDGAGNDRVDAGAADDPVAWVVNLNRGNRDTFHGDAGRDVMHLVPTRDDWIRADVQRDVANFLEFLDIVTSKRSCEADCRSFAFTSLGITVSEFEKLEIVVDGADLDPEDDTVVTRNDTVEIGEDATIAAGNKVTGGGDVTMAADGTFTWTAPAGTKFQSLALGGTKTIGFQYMVTDADGDTATAITKSFSNTIGDVDLNDVGHTATIEGVTISGSASGLTLDDAHLKEHVTVGTVTKAIGSTSGEARLTFSATSTTFDYLAQGELTYTLSVDDRDGGGGTTTFDISGESDDSLRGATGSDQIYGGADSDWIESGTGANELQGGDGADTIVSNGTTDLVWGDAGNDVYTLNSGNTSFDGGDGNDTVQMQSPGSLEAHLGIGNDFVNVHLARNPYNDVVKARLDDGDDRFVLMTIFFEQ